MARGSATGSCQCGELAGRRSGVVGWRNGLELEIFQKTIVILIVIKSKDVGAAIGGVGGAAGGGAVSFMCLVVHAVVCLVIVVADFEGCRLTLLESVNGDGVSLDGSGDIIVEVAQVDTLNGAGVGTGQLKVAEIGTLLGGHVVILPDGRLLDVIPGLGDLDSSSVTVILFVEDQDV